MKRIDGFLQGYSGFTFTCVHYLLKHQDMTFPNSGKIKVTPEQSVKVNEQLKAKGYKWKGIEGLNISSPHFIFWNGDTMRISWALGDMLRTFNNHPNPEYDMTIFDPTAYPLPQTEGDVWLTAITRAHRFADKDKRENNLSDDEREESFVGYLISNYSIKKL